MTERSFIERIVAILGVVVGTIVWVVRFLVSLLKDAAGKVSSSGDAGSHRSSGQDDESVGVAQRATGVATDLRSRAEAVGQTVAATARDTMEQARDAAGNLVNRDGGDSDESSGLDGQSAPEMTSVDTGDEDGIPETPNYGSVAAGDRADASGGSSGSTENEEAAADRFSPFAPGMDEPGGDTGDVYGNEVGALLDDHMPDGGYAGQIMQESDIGQNRGDDDTALAEGEEILPESELDRPHGDNDHLSSDEIDYEDDDEVEEDDDETDTVPVASRGWQGAGRDESVADDLYDDLGVTLSSDEIDFENDEMSEGDDDGMHIVDSPDESLVEVDSPALSLGLADEGSEMAFDAEVGQRRTFDADAFAADALGNRVGGDAASGDFGPRQSPDDVERDPDALYPDYEIQGTYDGSGVDEFATDEVAIDMLDDVGAMDAGTADQDDSGDASGSDTPSVAWASSAGVVDEDLTKPLPADELQGSVDEPADTDVLAEAGNAGVTEKDAGWRDAASRVAEQLDSEMGDPGVGSSGTTMSGAGQSSGAMTSDDAATERGGADEMTSNTHSVETGGITAPEAGDNDPETLSGDDTSRASMGPGPNPQFNDVLPERAYQESVGYESLQADKGTARSSDVPTSVNNGTPEFDSIMRGTVTTTGSSGNAPAVSGAGSRQGRSAGRQGNLPAGAVRGDGSGTCPAEYPIKGNANSRIYHRPTDNSYESTNPELCFVSEEAARNAGFRPRKG